MKVNEVSFIRNEGLSENNEWEIMMLCNTRGCHSITKECSIKMNDETFKYQKEIPE